MNESLPDTVAWRLIERMLLIRRFEEAVLRLAAAKEFAGHYHLYIGQEATGAAAMETLGERDHLVTTHRNHGHVIARGADPGRAFAEILGRATGLNGGRGGTIHLCDPALGFLSTSGIVGGCISLAVGGGYACKRRGDGSVTVAFFGDGALEEGVSFEAMNIASLWKLPVVFVCENNSPGSWAPGTGYPTLVHSSTDLGSIARSLNIETARIDGADAPAAYAAMSDAVARCRRGSGPAFVEAVTTRWAGSSPLWPEPATGDTDLKMAIAEAPIEGPHKEWYRHHDPVLRLARSLCADGGAAAADRLRALDADVTGRIAAAVEFALASPMPEPESALQHVYA
jgi:acetoin:2,6-dichlorophenolindophenol oxidoreductase subunit alpha